MFRFEALRQTGFFDPGFFLYYEEVDLMRRLRAAGWRILYTPDAQVIHAAGSATGQFAGAAARQRDPAYLYRSWTHYFSRAYGRAGALAIALAMWPAALVNILHRRLRGREPTIPQCFFTDHWRYVLRSLLFGVGRR
jgi:GT2 family glycosyltransferase